jgi:hypothetical protein
MRTDIGILTILLRSFHPTADIRRTETAMIAHLAAVGRHFLQDVPNRK